jgi:hypothetical protein
MPRGPEKVEGMTKPKRARKRKPETSQGGPEATNLQFSGGQGVHREVESEGHEEKYRAVIKVRITTESIMVSEPLSIGIPN